MKKSIITLILCFTAAMVSAKDYIDISGGWKFNNTSDTNREL